MPRSLKELNIRHLTTAMQDRFGDECDRDMIAEEVRSEYERLCRESKVTQFVPMLAERRVRRHLAKRCNRSAEALRTGVDADTLEDEMTSEA